MCLKKLTFSLWILLIGLSLGSTLFAVPPHTRWVVMLKELPVLQRYPGKYERTQTAAAPYRQHLRDVQAGVRAQIEGMHIRVTGAVQHVMNGLFVNATPAQAEALRQLPDVKAVLPLRQY